MRSARAVAIAVAALAVAAAPARAETTYCVGITAPGCVAEETAAAAFAAAAGSPGPDTIRLGPLAETGTFADADGEPVRVIGAGSGATRLTATGAAPPLTLVAPGSSAGRLALEAGTGPAARLAAGSLTAVTAEGALVVAGTVRLEDVAVRSGGPGLTVDCDGDLRADHVSVASTGASAVRAGCGSGEARLALRDSVAWARERGFDLRTGAQLTTAWSSYPEAPTWVSDSDQHADPAWMALADLRPRADSPLVDGADPAPLATDASLEDAGGDVRAADGNGDGVARRDIGAYERQPPAPARPGGNVLTNPGAEDGTPAGADGTGPAPPGWTRSGGFTFVAYGAGVFPSARVGAALGGGAALFVGGPGGAASATQLVDVSAAAPEIDAGGASFALSALIGGYRQDGEQGLVEAVARDPAGAPLATARLGPVTAAERGGATTLLPRATTGPLPPLTRTVAVTMRALPDAETYVDAYFDDVALIPHVPPAPPPDVRPPPGRPLRPFTGVVVLSSRAGVDAKGRAWAHLGCPDGTIGRCAGILTLTVRLQPGGPLVRVGAKPFGLRPGRTGRVGVPLTRACRRALRGRWRLRGVLYAAVRDAQGVARTKTAPLRVERRRPERRRPRR
jgi:hypothetical protein